MCSTEDQASSHQGVTNQATTNGKEERTARSEEAADAGVKTLNLVYQADGVYHLKKLMSLQAASRLSLLPGPRYLNPAKACMAMIWSLLLGRPHAWLRSRESRVILRQRPKYRREDACRGGTGSK